MSDAQCTLCLWLSEQPEPVQILVGVAFLVILVPGSLWLLSALTPKLDRQLERHLHDDGRHELPTTEAQPKAHAQVPARKRLRLVLLNESKLDAQKSDRPSP